MMAVPGLAALEAALVALPPRGALARLAGLRSGLWAAALPGSIVIGTVGPLWLPSFAHVLVLLAAVATPLLAVVAMAAVIRIRPALLVGTVLALALGTMLATGTVHQLSMTIVTALGCLTVGVTLTRVIPPRWLLVGVAVMAVVDTFFLSVGIGQQSVAAVTSAAQQFPGPHFDCAAVGRITVDFPDLVLAGVLGGFVAGLRVQRRAALALATAVDMLLPLVRFVPATVPIALTFGLLAIWNRPPRTSRVGAGSTEPARPVRTPRRLTRPATAAALR
jgi:hypothetical protein